MFGFLCSALAGPLLGGVAIIFALGLGASVIHQTGIPFLGLQGLNGKLASAESANATCRDEINNPSTGWAVRFKTATDNETRLKNALDDISVRTQADKAESDKRDAENTARVLALRQQNASLDRQVRQIRTQVPKGTVGQIARQAVALVLGDLQ